MSLAALYAYKIAVRDGGICTTPTAYCHNGLLKQIAKRELGLAPKDTTHNLLQQKPPLTSRERESHVGSTISWHPVFLVVEVSPSMSGRSKEIKRESDDPIGQI